ncbi:MAG: M48 family metalloprotease [Cellvibrionaceae bacterium]
MNFFEHQEQARKQTGRLLALFITALAGLVLLTAFLFASIAYVFGLYTAQSEGYESGQSLWQIAAVVFDWQYLGSISLAVLAIVGLAALFRISQLKLGGQSIAEQMGGRLINVNPRTASERQLLNIVEEMSIASGSPVPSVYIIDEPGINAFAAGYQPADAVIGVTQGAIDRLNRHELQGVIAHEFSHIFNGDMRLNLRLIGLIYGIMVIAIAGRYLLEGGRYSNKDRRAAISIGLVLMLLGYLGIFFGNIIKSAISRQREFLADASAVQFTRSQMGISGALRKIGGMSKQSLWQNHDANEVSHMLFSQGLHFRFFSQLMATHPPLDIRIKRMYPQWDGKFIAPKVPSNIQPYKEADSSISVLGDSAALYSGLVDSIDQSGVLTDQTMQIAADQLSVLRSSAEKLVQQVHEPYTARALVYVMLFDSNLQVRAQQWKSLQTNQAPELLKQITWVESEIAALQGKQPLILLDMSLPVLKLLTDDQYLNFKQQMLRLIKIDKKIELREWALFYLVDYYCRPTQLNRLQEVSLKQRKPALAQLLSALANVGSPSREDAKESFHSAIKEQLPFSLRWYSLQELTIQSLTQSLRQIRHLKPLEKPKFLKTCVNIVQYDGRVDVAEFEIISCIAQALGCPLPYNLIAKH